jgi:hypothetical protein
MGAVRTARESWESSSNTPPSWGMAAALMLLGGSCGIRADAGGGMWRAIHRQLAQTRRELESSPSFHLLSAARWRGKTDRIQPALAI